MATEQEMYELIGRAVADAGFRSKLLEDPARVAEDLGYELTEQQLAGLKEMDLEIVSEGLGERLSKFKAF